MELKVGDMVTFRSKREDMNRACGFISKDKNPYYFVEWFIEPIILNGRSIHYELLEKIS